MNPKCLLLLLAVCLLIGGVQAWGADMGAWEYRKEITINNTGSNLTNYQMMFTVNRSSGTDSGSTVYLNGKCQEDYDDIRFVGADDSTVWDYWIESSSSTVATVWVEVPSILNSTAYGNTTGYLYYGNSGATGVSDGNATFIFFDDFPGTAVDTTKWTVVANNGISVSNSLYCVSYVSGSYTYGIIRSVSSFGPNIVLRTKLQMCTYFTHMGFGAANHSGTGSSIGWANKTKYESAIYTGPVTSFSNWAPPRTAADPTTDGDIITDPPSGWFTDEFAVPAGDPLQWRRNDGAWTLSTRYTGISTAQPLEFGHFRYYGPMTCDWIVIRKYAVTEPTVSAWGSEELTSISVTSAFSALPLTGNIPLTVYFTDTSTFENCTIDTWSWSFGDGSANSTQQHPAHIYTTSGLHTVGLTVTNTSFSKTNSTTKFAYINVTTNLDAPNADFTVTETCGETTDTFYFIDYSTGGGLYQWNWSFGDGSYSELRNPTHQYSSNGTYDVGLTVWGAYGNDTLTRSNLITIPCGAATPTPTPTPTPTGTGGAVTEGNVTYILAPDQDYVPFPIWLAIVIVSIALFGHSIIFLRNSDLTAMMSAVFAFISAWLSNMIGYIDVQITSYAEEIVISPVIQAVHPPWLVYTMLIFAFVSIVNIFAAIYKVYLKPVPWNEIYDRKLPKWRNR